MGVQEVKWDKGGIQPADDFTFFCGTGNANNHLRFLVHKGVRLAIRRVQFVIDRMSHVYEILGVILFRICMP
jgi:hypothetical protein